ncbi:putative restriction endonuclease S subunit [Thiobacillus denitrificans ATCC 25259]|uniref:Putative restriction endonuclease S subunit n=1 Tax=Thiobacillus denitrificans (strain ATCC 25259 / T1) TaxID=292415 RepID=Q3SFH5_THIDA|nr:putative restriction endonuclease S subunit [Thiobacillus denitrificans ATCC 25259]
MNSQSLSAPISWRRMKLKYLVALKSGEAIPGESIKETGDYPVYGGNGFRGYTNSFTHEGERILIGRQGALCGNINYAEGKFWATEHAIVATPKTNFETAWLGETLRVMNLNQYSQSAAQPGIAVEVVENLVIAVPPEGEQRRIADSLHQLSAPIDKLILEKQKLLTLLTEKRRTVIADFLIKGLNKDTPRRDSDIPWLGEIPAHWKVERAKWLFTERDDRSDSGDEELLTVSHLTGVTSRAEKDVNMFMAESLEGYKRCEAGDLVINTLWAWMGAMGIARQPGIVSPAYNVYQPVAQLDPEYIDLLVRTPRFVEEITRYSKGVWSSRLRLYPEGLYEAWLPVPPLDEQRDIVARVQAETRKLDALAEATERTVTVLQERRSALISAAVTGQLDLGDAHAN